MKAKDLIKLLKKNGFPPISVPYHTKDIPIGTLNKILKDAGLK